MYQIGRHKKMVFVQWESMKKIICAFILILQSQVFAAEITSADVKPVDSKITVIYFGKGSDQEFNEKIKPIFNENSQCKNCDDILDHPIISTTDPPLCGIECVQMTRG